MNQVPAKVIYIVIIAIATLALIGVSSLCASLFVKSYADPSILAALISITSGLVGSLVTLLSSPRTPRPESPPNNGTGAVKIVNQPSEPVPTAPQESPDKKP